MSTLSPEEGEKMTPDKKQEIYWKSAKPEDFINAELLAWVQGVGDISTNFELNFVHAFGEAMRSRRTSITVQDREKDLINQERMKILKIIDAGKSALYDLEPDGHWSPITQAKMDVLCWLEEKILKDNR